MHIVLGRFQPFHCGHAWLVEQALERGDVTIAIGSAQAGGEVNNPWTANQRHSMIKAWLGNRDARIVEIDDINDPPRWVEHAKKFHGEGILVTSDEETALLYEQASFTVLKLPRERRESLEGWRIRKTLTMLSTIHDNDAVREVMKELLPIEITNWLIDNDAMYILNVISQEQPYTG